MTAVWVAEHGWTYLQAIIDCRTRKIVGWSLELRLPHGEETSLVDHGVRARLTRGTRLAPA